MFITVPLIFDISGGEIFVVLIIVLLFFGSKKIPDLAKGLGKGIRQFKDATQDIQKDIQESMKEVKDDLDIKKQIDKTIK